MATTELTKPTTAMSSPASSAEGLLQQAIAGNVPIETIERLVALREREMDRQAEAALIDALHRFQSECPSVVKDVQVNTKNGSPAYKYARFDTVAKTIQPTLDACGLMFSHTVEEKQVVCRVSHRDGAHCESAFPIGAWEGTQIQNSTQKMASAISYAKRYSLLGALGIATTDDDDAGRVDDPATKEEMRSLFGAWKSKHPDGKPDDFFAWAQANVLKSREIDEIKATENWTQRDVAAAREILDRVSLDDFEPAPHLPSLELVLDEINTGPSEAHARRQLELVMANQTHYGAGCEKVQAAYDKRFPPLDLKG